MVSNGTVAYSLGGTTGPATGGTGGTTHGLLPDKIIGEWWWPWNPPKISTVEAQAPQVNYLSLVGAFSNAQNNGNVNDGQALSQYGSEAALKADIDAWKASGRIVTGMIGGGGDTTIINNATNVQEFMAAAIPIIDRLGLQGVDFDLENTPDAASVASIISQLKAHYGADFIVSIDPRPYELRAGGVYRQIIQDVGINNIDLIMPQDYALNGDSLAAQRSYMDSDLADWINSGLLPASKLVIGSFDPAEGESVATAIQTYQFYKSVYPSLRGSMYWETREDATQTGWQWAIDMATA
jgi:chitinase